MKLTLCTALVAFPLAMMAQNPIFKSQSFSIFPDKVVQGKHSAQALSAKQVVSTYKTAFKDQVSRRIIFKFAINGEDNEQGFGIDHSLVLLPKNGKFTSPLLVFGTKDAQSAVLPENTNDILEANTEVILRLDMRHVTASFKKNGFYELYDGKKIASKDFKGVWIAGGTAPLNWGFGELAKSNKLQLTDMENDGIYELKLVFNPVTEETKNGAPIAETWKPKTDISKLPRYQSSFPISDALYNLSLDEMQQCVRDDGAFMAGAKWEGVWTRDISYSIILSLAIINPEAARLSLMKKVSADGKIIQDTGTGGSWPISSDRMVWALAAWEIFKVTKDGGWLTQAKEIIKNSVKDDENIFDPQTGLVYGESSFLDWREQTYPTWMDSRDIYKSLNLGTNAVHYGTYRILQQMCTELVDNDEAKYRIAADSIKKGINEFLWQPSQKYYGQYLYGREHYALSPRSEALGEALCVLLDITPEPQKVDVLQNTPVTEFGVPCIYPQIPNQPPYHNDAVWPFVQAYFTWAGARSGQGKIVEHGIAAMYRQAALFLTNKENLVASTGDFMGTVINSDRQLWSVAGNLAVVYRIFFGLNYDTDALYFRPFVPKAWAGERSLKGIRYANATLNIEMKGYGSNVKNITLNGKKLERPEIPNTLVGEQNVVIELDNNDVPAGKINMISNAFSPETPQTTLTGKKLSWKAISGANDYHVYKDGKKVTNTNTTEYSIAEEGEYQVLATNAARHESFLSEPKRFVESSKVSTVIIQRKTGQVLDLSFKAETDGIYLLDFLYANGNGPVNTENKCGIRTLTINGKSIGKVVMPQRGANDWLNKGYTNSFAVNLSKGTHNLKLELTPSDKNMNEQGINEAYIENLRTILK